MKIRIEADDEIREEEVVIRCRELDDDIIALQRRIAEAVSGGLQLNVYRSGKEYYLNLEEILFFETDGTVVAVHTVNQIYVTKLRLYELEEMLPGNFMRVSKSAILNTGQVRAIHKNITGASEVEFAGTSKKAFVSRSYFKALISKLEEKRLRK